jgi:hypothetical protein
MQTPCTHSNAQPNDGFCPDCGQAISGQSSHKPSNDTYCARCGGKVEKTDAFCPKCGTAHQPFTSCNAEAPSHPQQTTSRPTGSATQSRLRFLIPICVLVIIGATVLYAKWHTASGNLAGRYMWVNPNRHDFYIVLQLDAKGTYSVQRSFDPMVSRGTYLVEGKDITFSHHVVEDYYETFHGHYSGNTVYTGMLADEDAAGKRVFGTTEFAFSRQ